VAFTPGGSENCNFHEAALKWEVQVGLELEEEARRREHIFGVVAVLEEMAYRLSALKQGQRAMSRRANAVLGGRWWGV